MKTLMRLATAGALPRLGRQQTRQRIALILALALLPAAASGDSDDRGSAADWSIDRQQWSRPLAAGGSLSVRNEFGDIRIRTSGEPELAVSAVIQWHKEVADRPVVEITDDDGALSVTVRFPAVELATERKQPGAANDRRVDLAIFMPADAPLQATTWSGLLEARGLAARAELSTFSGAVRFSSHSSARVTTRRGAIHAAFRGTSWQQSSSFESVTGDILVELPTSADLLVTASTEGELTTDYSLVIERKDRFKQAVATIGDGNQELVIRTVKGAIKLLEGLP